MVVLNWLGFTFNSLFFNRAVTYNIWPGSHDVLIVGKTVVGGQEVFVSIVG